MLLNNVKQDLRELAIIKGKSLKKTAVKCGIGSGYSMMLKSRILTGNFLKFTEELGYDIEIRYVER